MGDFQYAAGVALNLSRQNRQAHRALNYANTSIEIANAEIRKGNAKIQELYAQIEALEMALLIERADAAGMRAYRDDLRGAHPNSPRLAASGQKFRKSGNPKPLAALAYDREFDRILREARISNPENYRD